jgi:hypothetical protein
MTVSPVGHYVRQAVHLIFVDDWLVCFVPRAAYIGD